MAVLREAAVVGATLSFSGSSALAALGNHFDVVIIDEAAQAVEPSTLIPLVAGCKQVGTGQIMRIRVTPAAQAEPAAAWTRQCQCMFSKQASGQTASWALRCLAMHSGIPALVGSTSRLKLEPELFRLPQTYCCSGE